RPAPTLFRSLARRRDVGRDGAVGAQEERGGDGQVVDDAAVGERAPVEVHGVEGAGEAGGGAHRADEVALGVHDLLARLDVGGHGGERHLELHEGGRQVLLEEGEQALALEHSRAQRQGAAVAPGGGGGQIGDRGGPAAGGGVRR